MSDNSDYVKHETPARRVRALFESIVGRRPYSARSSAPSPKSSIDLARKPRQPWEPHGSQDWGPTHRQLPCAGARLRLGFALLRAISRAVRPPQLPALRAFYSDSPFGKLLARGSLLLSVFSSPSHPSLANPASGRLILVRVGRGPPWPRKPFWKGRWQ